MRSLLLACTLFAAGCATVSADAEYDPHSGFSAEHKAACAAEGGCITFTQQRLQRLLNEAMQWGAKHGS
jgi:hypothetical protein